MQSLTTQLTSLPMAGEQLYPAEFPLYLCGEHTLVWPLGKHK